jgi:hypothetical protein
VGHGLENIHEMSKGIEVIPWNFAMVYVQIIKWVSIFVLKVVIPVGSGILYLHM